MDELVTHFPALAAWALVVIGGAAIALIAYGGKQVLARLDTQDAALESIRSLLASEVRTLREMQHQIDIRVTRIESACRFFHGTDANHHVGHE